MVVFWILRVNFRVCSFILQIYIFWGKIIVEERLKSMYDDKRFLTAKEILDKDFKIDARGYRPQ